jgi:hypothetical protein
MIPSRERPLKQEHNVRILVIDDERTVAKAMIFGGKLKQRQKSSYATTFLVGSDRVGACRVSTHILQAQNDDKISAGLWTWKTSGCADCHGPFADGDVVRMTIFRSAQTCGRQGWVPTLSRQQSVAAAWDRHACLRGRRIYRVFLLRTLLGGTSVESHLHAS